MTLPILLAPIQGVTNATFRRVYAGLFPGLAGAVAPFIPTATGTLPGPAHLREVDPAVNPPNLPLVPQILGNDGDDFLAVCRHLRESFGHTRFNWNIGCPVGTVSARKRGAGMLTHPDLIDTFLDRVFRDPPGTISLKMRLGMDSNREWEDLVPVLNRYPSEFVIVHGRTGVQGYRGHSDVDMFGELAARVTRPLYYNGDLRTGEEIALLRKRFPNLAGVMVGRGLIADPLLPSRANPSAATVPADSVDAFWLLHDELLKAYQAHLQPGAAVERMKEFLSMGPFASVPTGGPIPGDRQRAMDRALRQVLKVRRLEEYLGTVSRLRDPTRTRPSI